jgi:hypothetical protein
MSVSIQEGRRKKRQTMSTEIKLKHQHILNFLAPVLLQSLDKLEERGAGFQEAVRMRHSNSAKRRSCGSVDTSHAVRNALHSTA